MTANTERLATALAGRYRIERHLGEGGMASVYLAEDLKHDRKVALKLLKPELAAVLGAERFVQEIKTTAALQHPHILPLFDSGTADGFLFYVMPYIQGETLREKLNRETQFGVEEAVRIATDVAGALDYAHRHGVIHRDIKPENILMHDGRPMVADFGIALALSAAAGGRMTETGLSLGTPHYMSPEQATAEKEITGRSDVYSLGSVLYEMLTGNPPHVGASAQQIIMKIITEPAEPVTKIRKSVPPNVAAAVARSLEKLPADRFESAKAFADALGNSSFTIATLAGGHAAQTGSSWKARAAVPLGVAALLLLLTAAWGWMRPAPVAQVTRLDLSLGAVTPTLTSDVVISPDGLMLAVTGVSGGEPAVYLRRLGGDPDFRKLPGTETASGSPSFSPDGQWIVFRRNSDQALVKVAVTGGGAITLVPGPAQVFFPHWGTNDLIVYSGPQGFARIASAGGKAERLHATTGAGRYSFLLPDGSGLLVTLGGSLSVLDFETDSTTVLVPNAVHPVYVETGHLLYIAEGGGLFAVPFDLGRHRVTGPPVRVLDRVAAALSQRGYSVSKNGVLVYRDGESSVVGAGGTRFLIKSLSGATDTIRLPAGRRLMPRFSPDGRSIAYELVVNNRNGETDIHTFDLVTGTNTQITFGGDNDDPVWSPDGKRIAFNRDVTGSGEDLFVKPADNSGAEQLLLSLPGNQHPTGWVEDDLILFMSNTAGQYDLFTLSPKGGSKPMTYLEAPWAETDLHVSRDRKLAVFASAEAGAPGDIWLRDFPVAQGKWRVSSRGGSAPRWSPDGNYVYFWQASQPKDSLFRARVDRTPAIVVRAPELVMAMDIVGLFNWDIHPDGKRIIVTVDDAPAPAAGVGGAAPASRYLVVLNWFTELRALTGKGRR